MTSLNFRKINIEAYKPGRSILKKKKNVIKLSANESALGMSPKVLKILKSKNYKISKYVPVGLFGFATKTIFVFLLTFLIISSTETLNSFSFEKTTFAPTIDAYILYIKKLYCGTITSSPGLRKS